MAEASSQKFAPLVQQALTLVQNRDYSGGISLYHQQLQRQPDDVAAWAHLGIALRYMKNFESSAAALARAHELNPASPDIHSHRGRSLAALYREAEAIAAHAEAVRLAPENSIFHLYYAHALTDFGRYEEALAEYNEACRLKPDYAEARWMRVDTLLALGRLEEAWPDYEVRWNLGEGHSVSRLAGVEKTYASQRWKGDSLAGKTIMVYMEQGFGDTIFASRYLPQVKAQGGRVIVKCHPGLHSLFKTITGVDRFIGTEEPGEAIHYHVPIMSLPGIFGTAMRTIPAPSSLFAAASLPGEVADLLALGKRRFRVGIVWSGSPSYSANHRRAVSLKRFLPLAEVPGVQLYSLQKEHGEGDIAAAGMQGIIPELGPHMNDFADTATMLRQLDLVIMTDSSVAHLAGSLGVPVWNLLAKRCYWVYHLNREDSPWYPSMRLFRQPKAGDWDSVFERVAVELAVAARKKLTSTGA